MPIKELLFSFAISIDDLARALATSNSGMKVQVLGTEAEEVNNEPAALPPPTSRGARPLILAYMRKDPKRTYTSKELNTFAANYGFAIEATHRAIHNAHKGGVLRRVGYGQYRLTKAGVANGRD